MVYQIKTALEIWLELKTESIENECFWLCSDLAPRLQEIANLQKCFTQHYCSQVKDDKCAACQTKAKLLELAVACEGKK